MHLYLIFCYCSDEIADGLQLQSNLTFNQISPSTFPQPTDVTLKLSDGSIDAHRMILAAVSPVFERMFYGDFKEGTSRIVDLPADSYDIIKLLVDLVYGGSCKPGSLDDILPLNEVMDRYQMKKGAFYHMCGEVVLAKLDSFNYLTLLPKFVGVLNMESIKRVADKVSCYTKNSFIDKFDETKNLPEEVLLSLLQRDDIPNPEIDIFDFLIKWHDYQTNELKKILKYSPELFQCIRYFLISPHLLHTKVVSCSLDKGVLAEAINHLYQKPPNLDEDSCKCGECNLPTVHTTGRFRRTINISTYWKPRNKQKRAYYPDNKFEMRFNVGADISKIIESLSLKNGAYAFTISEIKFHHNASSGASMFLCVNHKNVI